MKITKIIKRGIFLFTSFVLLLSFANVGYTLVIEAPRETAEKNMPNGLQLEEEKEMRFMPGKVIVKIKEKDDPGVVNKSKYSIRMKDNSMTLDLLKEKHGLKDAVPVFKDLHNKLEADDLSVNDLAIATQHKYKDRQARAPKNAKRVDLFPIYIFDTDENVLALCEKLNKDSQIVEYATPDMIFKIYSTPLPQTPYIPNDYFVEDSQNRGMWREGSWTQPYPDMWGLERIKAIEGWNLFNDPIHEPGKDIVVAVIDTGVDYRHVDMERNVWVNRDEIPSNEIDDDGNGFADDYHGFNFAYNNPDPVDDHGHGTHCAGTIAAVGNNNEGIIGVAPNAKIMAVKGFDRYGSGDTVNQVSAIYYAVENGADILSNSWGGSGSRSYFKAIEDAFDYAYANGCTSIASAGNDNENVVFFYPASYESVISVGATDPNDRKANFSNWGYDLNVAAPGGGSHADDGPDYFLGRNILSLRAEGTDMYVPFPWLDEAGLCFIPAYDESSQYYRARGTSMACPHVAGVAAVIMSKFRTDPRLSHDFVRAMIMRGADNINLLNAGQEGLLGSGRVNVKNSLALEPGPYLKVMNIRKSRICPGMDGTLAIDLKNYGLDASAVTATLTTSNQLVRIDNNNIGFGDIAYGQTVTNKHNPFKVYIDPGIEYGESVNFNLNISCGAGYSFTFPFSITIKYFTDDSLSSRLILSLLPPVDINIFDYDNDGYMDIVYIGGNGLSTVLLLFKNCDGYFMDFTMQSGFIQNNPLPTSTVVIDSDNDGDKDVFATGSNSLFLSNGDGAFTCTSIYTPSGRGNTFDYNNDGLLDICGDWCDFNNITTVFENHGNNAFLRIDNRAIGITTTPQVFFDYDNDNDQDFANEYGLYRNNGDGTFTHISKQLDIGIVETGKNVAVGDYNNDGYTDILYTGIERDDDALNTNILYRNNQDGTFTDVTEEVGNVGLGAPAFWSGADFFDFDNDGDLDIYITRGKENTPMRTGSLYRNDLEQGYFTNVTNMAFPQETGLGMTKTVIGDFNNDGGLDIYSPASRGGERGMFLTNMISGENNWIELKLEGSTCNRDALGVKICLKIGEKKQYREVHHSAVTTQPIHFGVGTSNLIDEIEVTWPSGCVQKVNDVEVNQIITIAEVVLPRIENIFPEIAYVSDTITITGKSFGHTQGNDYVEFFSSYYGTAQGSVVTWTDTQITCRVPDGAQSGPVKVVTMSGRSNWVNIEIVPPSARVTGRYIFYNASAFDGNSIQANVQDDQAIAPDKQALLPGRTAAFANYTSYTRGINGIMVDIDNLPDPGSLSLANISNYFSFKAGNDNLPQNWQAAPAPSAVAVRQIDADTFRVTIIWPNGEIKKKWLQIRVLANAYTGLTQEDTFYFGNAVGEIGNSATDAKVNSFDLLGTRDNPRTFLNPAPIDFAYDFDRDKRVNVIDLLAARDNPTTFLNALKLISPAAKK